MRLVVQLIFILLVVGSLAWWIVFPADRKLSGPTLTTQWHDQVYGLEPDEVLRLLPRPLPPDRNAAPGSSRCAVFRLTPTASDVWGITPNGTLLTSIIFGTEAMPNDIHAPSRLADIPVDGDWVVRGDATIGRRAGALESILKQSTNLNLQIEVRPADAKHLTPERRKPLGYLYPLTGTSIFVRELGATDEKETDR